MHLLLSRCKYINIRDVYLYTMSLLVHPENQQLIWTIINSNPFVIQHFQTNSQIKVEDWFKTTMEYFYNLHKDRVIDKNDLNQLNKEILTHMIQSLHATGQQSAPSQVPLNTHIQPPPENIQPSYNSIQTPPIPENNKAQLYQNQFIEKKQEYQSSFDNKKPNEIDFREKELDAAIPNMDKLIQEQMNERAKHMSLHPPPSSDISRPVVADTSASPLHENIQLVPDNVTPKPVEEKYSSEILDKLVSQQTEISSLRTLIIEMSKQLADISVHLNSKPTELPVSTDNLDKQPLVAPSKSPEHNEKTNYHASNNVVVETVESGDESI